MKLHVRKQLLTCALIAGLGAGLGAVAQAQSTPAGTAAPAAEAQRGHHGHKFDPARRAERFNQRMAQLKDKLQVTPAQEPAWSSFTAAMQPPAQRQRLDRQALLQMTTPDRIDHMRAVREQRQAEMDRRGEATKAFYGHLNAEQQKTFDAETARMFSGKRMRHHHRG